MDLFIRFVCDEHLIAHRDGPMVTRLENAWAYCAGHGSEGHKWTAVAPLLREELERKLDAASPAVAEGAAAPATT
jgi:hypothetical protein